MTLQVFHYPACSTCKKALKWLDARSIRYERVHIVERAPATSELRTLLARGVPLRSLFNVSGESYRKGGFKERLATMSEEEALAALSADGKLIKRPLVLGDGVALVGFREEEWSRTLLHR